MAASGGALAGTPCAAHVADAASAAGVAVIPSASDASSAGTPPRIPIRASRCFNAVPSALSIGTTRALLQGQKGESWTTLRRYGPSADSSQGELQHSSAVPAARPEADTALGHDDGHDGPVRGEHERGVVLDVAEPARLVADGVAHVR